MADHDQPPSGPDRPAPDDEATRLASAPPPAARTGRPPGALTPGTVLNHTYRIEGLIARGGMGEIYRAVHTDLETEHAIKVILPELAADPRVLEMFRREATSLRNVRNDAIVAYDGVFRDEDGRLYLVMEFVSGPSLAQIVRRGPLPAPEVRNLLDRLAAGLAAAHDKGIVHRDMSPDNVILPAERLDRAKIIDFGIAKLTDPTSATVIGTDFAGKYSFVSPEQLGMFGGKVDERSDVYSLGLVLAAAALGGPLDMGDTHASVIEARRAVPDLSGIPDEVLRAEIGRMVEPDPAARPQTMASLIRARPAAAADLPRPAAPAPTGGRTRWLVLGAVLLVLLVGGGAFVYSRFQTRPATDIPVATLTPPAPAADHPAPTQLTPAIPATERAANPPAAPQVVVPAAPIPAPAPTTDRDAVLRQAMSGFSCAYLKLVGAPGDRRVEGFVASRADLDSLRAKVADADPTAAVAANIHEWPYCAALTIAMSRTTTEGPDVPGLHLNRPDGIYAGGDRLRVEADTSPRSAGYLYVTYLTSDGNAAHLLPMPLRPSAAVSRGAHVALGEERDYRIGPPFGRDMILAIWSSRALAFGQRKEVEPADAFLAALKEALDPARIGDATVTSAYSYLISHKSR